MERRGWRGNLDNPGNHFDFVLENSQTRMHVGLNIFPHCLISPPSQTHVIEVRWFEDLDESVFWAIFHCSFNNSLPPLITSLPAQPQAFKALMKHQDHIAAPLFQHLYLYCRPYNSICLLASIRISYRHPKHNLFLHQTLSSPWPNLGWWKQQVKQDRIL